MKIIRVPFTVVVIPILDTMDYMTHQETEPLTIPQIKTRKIYLYPRDIDGKIIMAAYDRETDTLYIQEKLQ